MDELDKNLPDDFWRKAFEEAAETPPPRVWNAIERRLDESEGPKVLPLWGSGLASSRPLMWATGLAAAVALLLVGWWTINSESATQALTQTQLANTSESVASSVSPRRGSSAAPSSRSTEHATRSGQNDAVASVEEHRPATERSSGKMIQSLPTRPKSVNDVVAHSTANPVFGRNSALSRPSSPIHPSASSALVNLKPEPLSRIAVTSNTSDSRMPSGSISQGQTELTAFERLNGKPMHFRKLADIQRIVWIRPTEPTTEPAAITSKPKARDKWASVSLMPGSFNPMVAVRVAQPVFANSSNAFTNTALVSSNVSSQPSAVNSRANFSVAYQAGAGVQLTERWSVESGVGYLSGQSTVETPGQQPLASIQMDAIANRNTASSNLFADVLRNSVQSSKAASNVTQTNYNLVANTAYRNQAYTSQQTITNDYQYVQVPVQVGYQLRPRKRLSMAVLGGFITNIFVRNTVGTELVVTSRDGVYRPVSLAATMGARFRYRPSRQWSASLAGVYQPSLGVGTQADSPVESRPTSAGMSFGVDYHF